MPSTPPFPAKPREATIKRKTEEEEEDSRAHLEAEAAETLQAEGRLMALEMLSTTPSCALLLNASQRHSASVFSTVFRPEQHVPSGLSTVLPLETKERQSAIVRTRLEQSTAGAGASLWDVDRTVAAEDRTRRTATRLM